MNIEHNKSLKELNTFGVEANAKLFVEISSVEELQELIQTDEFKNNEHLFLGGGSNILFTRDFDGLVIKNNLRGIEVIREDNDYVWVRGMAGEHWHDFTMYTVEQGWSGIENLSLIPGSVGAAPVQNIGAYGVEIKDTLETVETIDLTTGEPRDFANEECDFGYRTSVFKTTLKGKYFITAIVLKLSKNGQPNISYNSLRAKLEERGVVEPSVQQVSDTVIEIRQSKLPDPREIGNAGSFFKNPVIDEETLKRLQAGYPDMPNYDLENGMYKIPAAWCIETAGWKGKRVGEAGSHERQALVLVNHGAATGAEIAALAREIVGSVRDQFGIDLEPEVTII